jgi:Ca-activated chloride channel family protein
MVIFGKESYTLCPMTSDHAVLANMIQSVSTELIDGSSTAIGDGLVTALNRIKDGQAKSKTIILLTDGTNNAGDVAPRDAAEVARRLACASTRLASARAATWRWWLVQTRSVAPSSRQ